MNGRINKETVKIIFLDVAAIDFRINYFDNSIGAEGCGLYQIMDGKFVEKLVIMHMSGMLIQVYTLSWQRIFR